MPEAATIDIEEPVANREVVIEVRDLVTHYGPREILHSVGLDVYQGEILVIMGGGGQVKRPCSILFLDWSGQRAGTFICSGRISILSPVWNGPKYARKWVSRFRGVHCSPR